MVSFTPLPLYPKERTISSHWIGGSVFPRAGLEDADAEKRKFLTLPALELQPLSPCPQAVAIPTALSRLLSTLPHARIQVISHRSTDLQMNSFPNKWVACKLSRNVDIKFGPKRSMILLEYRTFFVSEKVPLSGHFYLRFIILTGDLQEFTKFRN
jgi:hypothetical protein